MSQKETKIYDSQGRFMQVVKDDRKLSDATWVSGRILLSNKRLLLVGNQGKRTLPLKKIRYKDERYDVNQAVAKVSGYVPLEYENDVLLVAPTDPDVFEASLYSALLDHVVVLVQHPAVEGGVVNDDIEWQKGRVKIELDPDDEEESRSVALALADGTFVEIELDDIGTIDTTERTVQGEKRPVIEVEHTEDTTSVLTYISGKPRHSKHLGSLLREGEQQSQVNVDLSEEEKRVLMALYSGVSPFEISDFVGLDVDRVEEIYDNLIEYEILDEVRVRREVALTARGRNIASGAMNDE